MLSDKDVRAKWYNLIKWYKEVTERLNKSGEGRQPLPEHFDILDAKLKTRKNINPPKKWIQSTALEKQPASTSAELDSDEREDDEVVPELFTCIITTWTWLQQMGSFMRVETLKI